MKFIFLISCMMVLSCDPSEEVSYKDQGRLLKSENQEQIQICHNPESKSHKKACSSDCFVPDLDEYSFCWTLWSSDCTPPLTYEWQKQNCHFFD